MRDSRSAAYASAILLISYVFAFADRQVINILLPSIKTDFDLTLVQVSVVQGLAFSLFFSCAGIPLGLAADRRNRRNLLATGIALWSLATVCCGLSNSFWQLFLARVFVGVGEACLVPASASLLADAYPPQSRGRAISCVTVGAPIGSLLGVAGGGWALAGFDATGVLAHLGLALKSWQAVFVVLGAPGLVVALLMTRIEEPPRREAAASPAQGQGSGLMALLKESPLGFSSFAAFKVLMAALAFMLLAWTPTLFMTTYGLSSGAAGTLIGMMLVVSSVSAYVVSGVASDALVRVKPRCGRVVASGIVLPIGVIAVTGLYFAHDVATTATALAFVLFVSTFASAGGPPALQAIVPNRLRGVALASLTLFINLLGVGAGPTLVALVAERFGGRESGLQWALTTVCLATMIAAAIIWPVLLTTYSRMRNYEAEELAEERAETAPRPPAAAPATAPDATLTFG